VQQSRPFALACLVLAMALWGSSFIALKLAFAEWPAMWVIFARMAIGSLIFLAAWRWRGRMDYRAGDWKYLVGLAVCEPDQHAPQPLLGNFFELLAMVCATGYTLLLKHLSARYSPFILTAMQAFIGSVFFLPLAAVGSGVPPAPSGQGLFALVYLGSVVTVGAYGLYNFGVSRLPASQATGFINLIPVFTLVFAWLLLGERLNGQQLLAAGLVFAGVALSQWRSATPAPAACPSTSVTGPAKPSASSRRTSSAAPTPT
jgi:drug/metabolite transporter (DMT)-like permease